MYTKSMDAIYFDALTIEQFQVEIGSMDYGMEIDGIIGFDYMKAARLVIDTKSMSVKSGRAVLNKQPSHSKDHVNPQPQEVVDFLLYCWSAHSSLICKKRRGDKSSSLPKMFYPHIIRNVARERNPGGGNELTDTDRIHKKYFILNGSDYHFS